MCIFNILDTKKYLCYESVYLEFVPQWHSILGSLDRCHEFITDHWNCGPRPRSVDFLTTCDNVRHWPLATINHLDHWTDYHWPHSDHLTIDTECWQLTTDWPLTYHWTNTQNLTFDCWWPLNTHCPLTVHLASWRRTLKLTTDHSPLYSLLILLDC
jgi:hypothetical protein